MGTLMTLARNGEFVSIFALVFTVLTVGFPNSADSQTPNDRLKRGECTLERSMDNSLETIRLRITPSQPPVPALKYRFYYRVSEQRAGNRAGFYRRTFNAIDKTRQRLHEQNDDLDGQALDALIDIENLRASTDDISQNVYPRLRDAATRQDCDWGFGLTDLEGPELLTFELPELSPMRMASRLLSVKSRYEIEQSKFGEAFETIRVGYQISQDVAEGETFVNKLVGIAMAAIAHAQVANFVATPESPNLYWALGSLDDPFIDMRSAVRYESDVCSRVLPLLKQTHESHSPVEWTRRIGDALVDFASVGGELPLNEDTPPWQRHAAATAFIAAAYPDAKRQLVAAGMDATDVEAMPAGQVVLMQQARVVEFITDEMEKACYTPPYDSQSSHRGSLPEVTPVGQEYLPIASFLLPAMNAARAAQFRSQREIASLRVIEAIRAHLVESNGRLPATLDTIKALPVPLNPITCRPFEYRLDGDKAILDLPQSDIPEIGYARRYEIKVNN